MLSVDPGDGISYAGVGVLPNNPIETSSCCVALVGSGFVRNILVDIVNERGYFWNGVI